MDWAFCKILKILLCFQNLIMPKILSHFSQQKKAQCLSDIYYEANESQAGKRKQFNENWLCFLKRELLIFLNWSFDVDNF